MYTSVSNFTVFVLQLMLQLGNCTVYVLQLGNCTVYVLQLSNCTVYVLQLSNCTVCMCCSLVTVSVLCICVAAW